MKRYVGEPVRCRGSLRCSNWHCVRGEYGTKPSIMVRMVRYELPSNERYYNT
ncbi:hypothetical protein [Nostoc sp.]|uniref:hypothetical protein n=1 Tax=Nostoc sp. TaxID=1180 RepID=UPI002FF49108